MKKKDSSAPSGFPLPTIKKIKQTDSKTHVNQLLSRGWVLLALETKGDSHVGLFDYTTSNDFEYFNYPAFSPPSNWVKTNFKNSKSGFVFFNIDKESNTKVTIPYWF